MIKQKVEFLKSAVLRKDWPDVTLPEIALVGRSNAGKSSLLNQLVGKPIAKISQTPGKTRLLNFFEVKDQWRWVDTPGYGFASRSDDEQKQWQKMMTNYLTDRENLMGVVLVMDIRRSWQQDEIFINQLCQKNDRRLMVALTKADKCNQKELNQEIKKFVKISEALDFHVISNTTLQGIAELEDQVYRDWIMDWKIR